MATDTDKQQATRDPGIYPSLSWPDYLAIDAMNGSTLAHGLKSMEHLKAAIDGELDTDSRAKAFGRAVHMRLLEPELFGAAYLIAQPCAAIIGSGKRKGDVCGGDGRAMDDEGNWFCGTHAKHATREPDDALSADDATRIERIAEKVKRHPVERLRQRHGHFEVVVVGEIAGVAVKGRIDKLLPPQGKAPPVIIDLKTVDSGRGTERAFSNAIRDYHYDLKAALYAELVRQHYDRDPVVVWLVVESNAPHSIAVYSPCERTMQCGRNQYASLIARYKQCLESDEWPGYSWDVETISAPNYHLKQWGNE